MIKKRSIFPIVSVVFVLTFFFIPFSQAALIGNTNQAVLTASPQTGNYNINETFPVSIYVNTRGQSVVVAAAYLNYDRTNFEAVSIDTTGSVFTMEAERTIDSTNGLIKITRGIPTPGVNTANGLVATINFRAIAATTPASDNLTFQFVAGLTTESNVILNDGLGTDYLSGVYNALFSVYSLPQTPTCTGCGLGTPTVTPASPTANTGFTITCPANNTGYDCLDAYVNETVCSFSQWSGNNAVFNCQGAAAGSYTAKCAAKTGTGQDCCADQKTVSFSVPSSGNGGGGGGGGGGGETDTTAPVISDIKVSETTFSSMTIIWKTHEPATSQVEYGTTKDYGLFSPLSSSLATSHLVKITGLAQKTDYYFRVISKDSSGNQSFSPSSVATTQSRPKLMGDFNSDGKVNIFDLSILLSNWKKAKLEYDLNEDGLVSIFDLSILLSNWTK